MVYRAEKTAACIGAANVRSRARRISGVTIDSKCLSNRCEAS